MRGSTDRRPRRAVRAFPPDIRKDTDMLHITRTWTFAPGDRLFDNWRRVPRGRSNAVTDRYAVIGNPIAH